MIFKTKKVLGYGIYPALFILFLIFFNNCQNQYDDYNDPYYNNNNRYGGSSNRYRNNSDLREVNTSSGVRFEPISKSQFEGGDCDEFDECQDLCDEMFSGGAQERCESLPEDMVDALYDAYENLKHASMDSLQRMDPSAMAVLIDMDDRFINFFRDDWGIRGISALINHTVRSPLMIEAFRYGNNEETFKDILLEFARLRHNNSSLVSAFSVNVVRHRETILTLIKNSDNKEAMQFVFDLLSRECSSLQCKQQILCVREDISRRSSRDGYSGVCPYLGPRDRSDYCYIQGPDVWSYVENLIYDGDLNDQSLANLELNERMCNSFCSRNNCYL